MQKALKAYMANKNEKTKKALLKFKGTMSFECIVLVLCPELQGA